MPLSLITSWWLPHRCCAWHTNKNLKLKPDIACSVQCVILCHMCSNMCVTYVATRVQHNDLSLLFGAQHYKSPTSCISRCFTFYSRIKIINHLTKWFFHAKELLVKILSFISSLLRHFCLTNDGGRPNPFVSTSKICCFFAFIYFGFAEFTILNPTQSLKRLIIWN